MDSVVDQTWVGRWSDLADRRSVREVASWVSSASPSVQKLCLALPPHCLVRRKKQSVHLLTEAEWSKEPAPLTIGIVRGYHGGSGEVLVRQHPSQMSGGTWWAVDELELVRPWSILSTDYLIGHIDALSSEKKGLFGGLFEKAGESRK